RKPKRSLPLRETRMLMIENARGELLLYKRPPAGIWGGLWSLPEQQQMTQPLQALLGAHSEGHVEWPVLRHSFTHFHLDITAVQHTLAPPAGKTNTTAAAIMEAPDWLWYNVDHPADIGLPAPVSKLLAQFALQRKAIDSSAANQSQQLPATRFSSEELST
ncbi:MAG: NUDIX domain-containing protein, partial [Pseudomonadales bacterium]